MLVPKFLFRGDYPFLAAWLYVWSLYFLLSRLFGTILDNSQAAIVQERLQFANPDLESQTSVRKRYVVDLMVSIAVPEG